MQTVKRGYNNTISKANDHVSKEKRLLLLRLINPIVTDPSTFIWSYKHIQSLIKTKLLLNDMRSTCERRPANSCCSSERPSWGRKIPSWMGFGFTTQWLVNLRNLGRFDWSDWRLSLFLWLSNDILWRHFPKRGLARQRYWRKSPEGDARTNTDQIFHQRF